MDRKRLEREAYVEMLDALSELGVRDADAERAAFDEFWCLVSDGLGDRQVLYTVEAVRELCWNAFSAGMLGVDKVLEGCREWRQNGPGESEVKI